MRTLLAALLVTLTARTALTDEREINLVLTSGPTALQRHGSWNLGGGAQMRAGYGIVDALAVEASGGCDYLSSMAHPGGAGYGDDVDVIYNATRCAFVPGLQARFGARYVWSVAAGLGYRYERRTDRVAVSRASNVQLTSLPKSTQHHLVGTIRGGFEYRIWDYFAVGADILALKTLAYGPDDLELRGALTLGVYVYP